MNKTLPFLCEYIILFFCYRHNAPMMFLLPISFIQIPSAGIYNRLRRLRWSFFGPVSYFDHDDKQVADTEEPIVCFLRMENTCDRLE